jgi:RNA polymerase sigma-70 factor, ECF subfamily
MADPAWSPSWTGSITVWAFEIEGERIKHIWAMRNPDKLHPWTMG